MDSAITISSNILLTGDFSRYIVVDRLGVTLTLDPMVLRANRRPTGPVTVALLRWPLGRRPEPARWPVQTANARSAKATRSRCRPGCSVAMS
jgi:hypothetical protein